MEFTEVKTKKLYRLVVQQIQEMIYEGKLKAGDRLPTERELVKQLNISRASIREALRSLDIMGLVESRPGEGTFITRPRESSDHILTEAFSLGLILEDNVSIELLDFRRILECGYISLAAQRIDETSLNRLEDYCKKMSGPSGDEKENINADTMFHMEIARASKNQIVYDVALFFFKALNFHIKTIRIHFAHEPKVMSSFVEQHRKILAALKNHDPETAVNAMRFHLDYVEKLIRKEIKG